MAVPPVAAARVARAARGAVAGLPGLGGAPFTLGGYTLDPANPIHYLVLWGLTLLVALALAGPLPDLAVGFSAALLFGTLIAAAGGRLG